MTTDSTGSTATGVPRSRGRRARIRPVAALLVLLATAGAVPAGLAQDEPARPVSERSLKAAFIYKFLDYVEWPADSLGGTDRPITIGVLGARSLAEELAEITAGRSIGERAIRIRRLQPSDVVDDLHLLFIGHDESERLEALIAPARYRPILTVTESENAVSAGSIINFIVEEERVRFEISLREAEQSRLRLNSRLLAVAKAVHRRPRTR